MLRTAGFSDPVIDSALTFRLTLEAMARPGRVQQLAALPSPPGRLSPTAAAVALSLVDGDALAWLSPALRTDALNAYLRFHTGAAPTTDPARAAFAFGDWASLSGVAFPIGTPEYPDRSTTLVIEVEHLAAGGSLRLTGPGIAEAHCLETDLPRDFWAMRAAHNAAFPLGRDVILTCGDRLAALPRTTRAEV
jgi:alpha-D-ribose 1-methylphosphonate 5-triphosphate synthase subunit PhnH